MVTQLYIRPAEELSGPLPTIMEIKAAHQEKVSRKREKAEKAAAAAAARQAQTLQHDQIVRRIPRLIQRVRVHVSDLIKPRTPIVETPKPRPTIATIRATSRKEVYTVAIDKKFYVKFGPGVQEYEGQVLQYLESFPEVPTPTLYAILKDGDDIFLVMRYLSGCRLSTSGLMYETDINVNWPERVTRQLHDIMKALRAIPPPVQQTFGDINNGPVRHPWFCPQSYYRTKPDPGCPKRTGPFNSGEDFVEAMVWNAATVKREFQDLLAVMDPDYDHRKRTPCDMFLFFESQLPSMLEVKSPVLTHSALDAKNIIIDWEYGPGGSELVIRGIINWEYLGWYPAYWEFAMAFINLTWERYWWDWLEGILDPWVREAALLRMLHDFSLK